MKDEPRYRLLFPEARTSNEDIGKTIFRPKGASPDPAGAEVRIEPE